MKLATTTCDFFKYGLNDVESILAVKEAGFKYVDYSFSFDHSNGCGLLSRDWKPFADKILEIAQQNDLKFVQAHSPLGRPLILNSNHEQFIKDTKQSIETAAYIGIRNIVVHAGYRENLSKEETFKLNKEFYLDILEVAEKNNINVLTENYEKMRDPDTFWFDNAQDLKDFVEYVDHPLLKVCWDTGHANMQKMPQHEELKILGDKVAAIHFQDNAGDWDDHIIPTFGTLSIDSVMKGLKEIGYNGYFTFEADNTPFYSWRKPKKEYDYKCFQLPLDFRKRLEAMMYDIGKFILTEHNCFEE